VRCPPSVVEVCAAALSLIFEECSLPLLASLLAVVGCPKAAAALLATLVTSSCCVLSGQTSSCYGRTFLCCPKCAAAVVGCCGPLIVSF
jgi:hypothetical protein